MQTLEQQGIQWGECRRHSPQALVFVVDAETKFESRFPVTQASAWCGEFEKT